jgi:H+-transporting ATPase
MKAVKRKPQNSKINGGWDEEVDVENQDVFDNHLSFSHGISSDEAQNLMFVHGKNELPEKNVSKFFVFLSLMVEPMPIMIWIAIIIEAVISKWMDMTILLAIQFTNTSVAFYETTKAGDAVAALKSSLRPEATVKRDNKWRSIDASLLVPGDLVLLSTGSAVPADCRINEGSIEVDQSSLTGEALPVAIYKGDSCKMGSTVSRGEVEATVEFTGGNTFFGRTAQLLQVSSYEIYTYYFY